MSSRSIGIEICNPPLSGALGRQQIETVIALCVESTGRQPKPAQQVARPSGLAPSRKADPSELFPWDRLHAAALGLNQDQRTQIQPLPEPTAVTASPGRSANEDVQ